MFRNRRGQRGFSLIELLVVVIIITILAAIAVPIYLNYVQKARSTEAQTALATIRNSFRIYYQTYGSTDDYTIEDAMKDSNLGRGTERNWDFEVIGNPPKKYIATSTVDFPEGEGKQVWYDVDEARYHGYGIDDVVDEDDIDY